MIGLESIWRKNVADAVSKSNIASESYSEGESKPHEIAVVFHLRKGLAQVAVVFFRFSNCRRWNVRFLPDYKLEQDEDDSNYNVLRIN